MSIGYACLHIGNEKTKLSTLRLRDYSEENLINVISVNLDALETILQYNIKNDISLYRISSDIIPLGSHPVNKLRWWETHENKLNSIGNLIRNSGMRVSMHPGQYTVLNSIRNDVVEKALNDLQYHCRFLDALGCDETCKVILHIGGIYSDKKAATERFVSNYRDLDGQIKKRLVIENDDKSYNIRDVLMISDQTGVPVVFDNLHHNLNNIPGLLSEYDLIDQCRGTWSQIDGKQKIHYSQQSERGIRGAHSDSIKSCDFVEFYNGLHSKDVDIMLEVKDKNLSAKKCILLTVDNLKIRSLEEEWARYKYYVLSRSVLIYNEIRNLLKNKIHPDVSEFYALIEETSAYGEDRGAQINAALHVWGHVNSDVGDKIKIRFKKLIDEYAEGTKTLKSIKKLLHKLAEEQSETYLLNSLYFYI